MKHLKIVGYLLATPILVGIFSINNLYAEYREDQTMFKNQINARPDRLKNLENITFTEKSSVESAIDELLSSSQDPYAESLPLIASAEIGDKKRYELAREKMLNGLEILDKNPESAPQWMQNNSFKAWMWGRVLLAADSVNDTSTAMEAQERLQILLKENVTASDNFAFFTWAWGYRAAYDKKEYEISKKRMLDDASKLTMIFNESREHGALSDALWAWVMNLQAAAYAGDQSSYEWIKEQMKLITGKESVSQALEKGLLRTAESNDYPAWAMAKVRCAAIIAGDKELYRVMESSLISSIDGAQKANAKAEYVLSILDNQLAIYTAQYLHAEKKSGFAL
jgi:hypothetical protein